MELLKLIAPAYYVIPMFILVGFVMPLCVMLYFEKTKKDD